MLFLDFNKVFDTAEHAFLLNALNFFGSGESFCSMVQMFYTDIYSSVALNPEMIRFNALHGIRQGFPISPK